MARPSGTPRLRDVDPAAWAANVVRLVTDHVVSLMLQLDPGALLAFEARCLAHYAQRGLPVADWSHHGSAADALVSVCAMLYSQAGRPGAIGGPEDVDVDPTEPIDIVLLAAQARIRIDRRQRVPVRELAYLAGVDPDHVRLLGRKGEITIEDGTVKPSDAKRWLKARGIEGL